MASFGSCPNCLKQGRASALVESPAGCFCHNCNTGYTLGFHGTLARARRSASAERGWELRRLRHGRAGGYTTKAKP